MPPARTAQEEKGSTANSCRTPWSYALALGALLVGGVFLSILSGLQSVSSNLSAASRFWFQGDTWWHLAIGKQILLTHTCPRMDIFSFTMTGSPWLAYEWLGEVVMAAAWKIGGLQGLMALLTVLAGAVLVLLFCYSYLRSRNLISAFIACALLLPLAAQSFSVRPQMFGYVFLLITLIALERFRQGHRKLLWVLPAVFLIWVNVHGTFILGFGALGIYLVGGSVSFRWAGLCAQRWTPAQRWQ